MAQQETRRDSYGRTGTATQHSEVETCFAARRSRGSRRGMRPTSFTPRRQKAAEKDVNVLPTLCILSSFVRHQNDWVGWLSWPYRTTNKNYTTTNLAFSTRGHTHCPVVATSHIPVRHIFCRSGTQSRKKTTPVFYTCTAVNTQQIRTTTSITKRRPDRPSRRGQDKAQSEHAHQKYAFLLTRAGPTRTYKAF